MNDKFKFESHAPKKRKNISWPVCSGCGLIYLNNDFTAWAIKKGCNNQDHDDYEKERLKVRPFKK